MTPTSRQRVYTCALALRAHTLTLLMNRGPNSKCFSKSDPTNLKRRHKTAIYRIYNLITQLLKSARITGHTPKERRGEDTEG